MNRWSAGLALGLLLTGGCLAVAEGLHPGDALPMGDVKMENVDGRMLAIGETAGKKGTLVIFSCNHCPFVKAWEQRMTAIGNDCLKQGIGAICINANDTAAFPDDDMSRMKEQARAAGYAFAYVMDATSEVARAFGATRTPEAFLFDAAGKLVYHGAIDDNAHQPDKVEKHYLQDAVAALLAGREPPVKETSSVGCSIKFRNKQEPGK
jgi:hypothetical protein